MYKIIAIISLVLSMANNARVPVAAPDQLQSLEEKPLVSCTMHAQEKSAPTVYKRMATVYSLESADDAVIVVDGDGELWEFYGVEDWAVGDWCELTMIDAGKSGYQWDDEITRTIYKGVNPDFE